MGQSDGGDWERTGQRVRRPLLVWATNREDQKYQKRTSIIALTFQHVHCKVLLLWSESDHQSRSDLPNSAANCETPDENRAKKRFVPAPGTVQAIEASI